MSPNPEAPGVTRHYANLLDDPAAVDLADTVAALDAHTACIAPSADPPTLALPRRDREAMRDHGRL
jgi:hypothetical protein